MNIIKSNEASLEFDLNSNASPGGSRHFFTEPKGKISCHEVNTGTLRIMTSFGGAYDLKVSETEVDEESFENAKELAKKISSYSPFSDGGVNVSSGVQIINIEEVADSGWIQDDRLKGAKEINLIIMQGTTFEPPFVFDSEIGAIQFNNQQGDKLTVIFAK